MSAAKILMLLLFGVAYGDSQIAPATQAPHVPVGSLSNGVYANETLGVRLTIPKGWEGTLSSGEGDFLDAVHPDSQLSRCSQILLSRKKMVSGTDFRSSDVLFVMSPACLGELAFPASSDDHNVIAAFVNRMVKLFHGTVYVQPSGVDYGADHTPQHLFIWMKGEGFRTADGEKGGKQIHANTLITVTASGGYWIAWAALVDDAGKKQLEKDKIQIRED